MTWHFETAMTISYHVKSINNHSNTLETLRSKTSGDSGVKILCICERAAFLISKYATTLNYSTL